MSAETTQLSPAQTEKVAMALAMSKKLGVDLESRLENLRQGVSPYDVYNRNAWPVMDGRPTPSDLLTTGTMTEFRKRSTIVLAGVSGTVSFTEIRKELEEYGEIARVRAKLVQADSGYRTVFVEYYNPKMAHALVNATRDPHTLRANGVIPKYCQGHEDQRWSTQLSTTEISASNNHDMSIDVTSGEIIQICNFGLYDLAANVAAATATATTAAATAGAGAAATTGPVAALPPTLVNTGAVTAAANTMNPMASSYNVPTSAMMQQPPAMVMQANGTWLLTPQQQSQVMMMQPQAFAAQGMVAAPGYAMAMPPTAAVPPSAKPQQNAPAGQQPQANLPPLAQIPDYNSHRNRSNKIVNAMLQDVNVASRKYVESDCALVNFYAAETKILTALSDFEQARLKAGDPSQGVARAGTELPPMDYNAEVELACIMAHLYLARSHHGKAQTAVRNAMNLGQQFGLKYGAHKKKEMQFILNDLLAAIAALCEYERENGIVSDPAGGGSTKPRLLTLDLYAKLLNPQAGCYIRSATGDQILKPNPLYALPFNPLSPHAMPEDLGTILFPHVSSQLCCQFLLGHTSPAMLFVADN